MNGLHQFVQISRVRFQCRKKAVRTVYISELTHSRNGHSLDKYISDRAPLFYRELSKIIESFGDGYFVSSIVDTLRKLPNSQTFRESHFGEITAAIFAEEVMGLRKIYSKLSLLTAENSNAYKMDLVMYDPKSNPIELIFGEVKSSPKTAADGLPANHHKSCFADIFNSLNHYTNDDLNFDFGAARDRMDALPEPDRTRVREALLPYSDAKIRYIGFAIIDSSTKDETEISVLATRKNNKQFDVDVVCVEEYPQLAESIYHRLDKLRQACLK